MKSENLLVGFWSEVMLKPLELSIFCWLICVWLGKVFKPTYGLLFRSNTWTHPSQPPEMTAIPGGILHGSLFPWLSLLNFWLFCPFAYFRATSLPLNCSFPKSPLFDTALRYGISTLFQKKKVILLVRLIFMTCKFQWVYPVCHFTGMKTTACLSFNDIPILRVDAEWRSMVAPDFLSLPLPSWKHFPVNKLRWDQSDSKSVLCHC